MTTPDNFITLGKRIKLLLFETFRLAFMDFGYNLMINQFVLLGKIVRMKMLN